jgi:hypothetical protein
MYVCNYEVKIALPFRVVTCFVHEHYIEMARSELIILQLCGHGARGDDVLELRELF